MRKRKSTPFSLAFLDIMFCGFGAVVLLVLILNGQVLREREAKKEDLQGELDRVTALYEFASAHLSDQKDEIVASELRAEEIDLQVGQILAEIPEAKKRKETVSKSVQEHEQVLKAIAEEIAALEKAKSSLESQKVGVRKPGSSVIGFTGDGERQYLTGLKLRGQRTLILFDSSASMLDVTIVNIVRRKLMSAELRRIAPKWQRAVRSLRWLLANLRSKKQYQVYSFNTKAWPLVAGTDGQWLDTSDTDRLQSAVAAVRELAPDKGTSLHNALAVARRFKPAPDSIVLLTDGLPTLGVRASAANKISGIERLKLFEAAIARLPKGIPINTLLFPIEGDPTAAEAFWRLAIATRGSFIAPSQDWP